ncbi:MAG: 16S rRNA (adenine(1518)-N(6)/adenine(1519)-N(6))-dimethyltransferase RsmA [Atopobiaceae bacterium]|jgi:16S rRNA (adenine1518-N6/adenine1519-N6)-dimethyltransferase|nr:16S rRNA (adenine(1518)-N(6)/adenine(1519)-N(6))-dimethyltransferase RsmA [Atopobiaceae bacterium]MCH4180281.1 16S rRNA (adenine(1518)-N(6)/adenine(1519)-N(6))-dimethyltransferase RsmA [Atopobiaceae bacterium]MCH4214767.1 16S rRNA (adenine(1518)-N(6)/adenine(1519)-N(6))-dimethyltransferase RsmA [Atopobiaceae bacterium]MCH4229993.1 16S rRNA (adenine(1518)-N(6)/adenine(1519)-N(6))-dimethyltransferase RsmA [Atopobiaceae bacterium]MCH4276924.1 16S rRNA (adenine(1518)-N(6)/adenine(1519)-N(6))-dim
MVASPLANPQATRDVLERHGLAAKHHLGQNFLVNDAVIAHILELAELDEKDAVLEVGPGIGTLTVALAAGAGAVVAVEADRSLAPVLAETCADVTDRIALVLGDALKVGAWQLDEALSSLEAPGVQGCLTSFVSNLPYQVAATVLLRFLQEEPTIDRAVVMVQREVADRIAAVPGTKAYGAYTAKLALQAEVTGRFEVGPGNFMPPPHVDSSVVRLDRRVPTDPDTAEPLSPARCEAVAAVIDAAFAQRRKTIRNSMSASGLSREELDVAFAAAGIDPRCRAETLDVGSFVRLESALGRSD